MSWTQEDEFGSIYIENSTREERRSVVMAQNYISRKTQFMCNNCCHAGDEGEYFESIPICNKEHTAANLKNFPDMRVPRNCKDFHLDFWHSAYTVMISGDGEDDKKLLRIWQHRDPDGTLQVIPAHRTPHGRYDPELFAALIKQYEKDKEKTEA